MGLRSMLQRICRRFCRCLFRLLPKAHLISDLDKGVQECFTVPIRPHAIAVALDKSAEEVRGENLLNDDHRSEGQKIVDAVQYITNKYPKLVQFVRQDRIQLLQRDDEENQLSPPQHASSTSSAIANEQQPLLPAGLTGAAAGKKKPAAAGKKKPAAAGKKRPPSSDDGTKSFKKLSGGSGRGGRGRRYDLEDSDEEVVIDLVDSDEEDDGDNTGGGLWQGLKSAAASLSSFATPRNDMSSFAATAAAGGGSSSLAAVSNTAVGTSSSAATAAPTVHAAAALKEAVRQSKLGTGSASGKLINKFSSKQLTALVLAAATYPKSGTGASRQFTTAVAKCFELGVPASQVTGYIRYNATHVFGETEWNGKRQSKDNIPGGKGASEWRKLQKAVKDASFTGADKPNIGDIVVQRVSGLTVLAGSLYDKIDKRLEEYMSGDESEKYTIAKAIVSSLGRVLEKYADGSHGVLDEANCIVFVNRFFSKRIAAKKEHDEAREARAQGARDAAARMRARAAQESGGNVITARMLLDPTFDITIDSDSRGFDEVYFHTPTPSDLDLCNDSDALKVYGLAVKDTNLLLFPAKVHVNRLGPADMLKTDDKVKLLGNDQIPEDFRAKHSESFKMYGHRAHREHSTPFTGIGLVSAIKFHFRHWNRHRQSQYGYEWVEGDTLYIYVFFSHSDDYHLFEQVRFNKGAISPDVALMSKSYDPAAPCACLQVTLGEKNDRDLTGTTYKFIRINGDMETKVDLELDDELTNEHLVVNSVGIKMRD